jgi:formate dehydrogenase major subunit
MDTGPGAWEISRRDFLKATAAATAAVGCGIGFAYDAEKAAAYENNPTEFQIKNTTCPYCSASCGQRVVVALTGPKAGQVVDLYGDFESPMNQGGLCAKGAGTLQLVNNRRRLGAYAGSHPVDPAFAYDATYNDGIAYKRIGNDPWAKVTLDAALTDIATQMKGVRDADPEFHLGTTATGFNSHQVAFFGSSHINNEPNFVYRKIIANFGTSNVEHQARI